MTADERAMLHTIETQAVAMRCIAENLLAMVSSLLGAEDTLPGAPVGTPVAEPTSDIPTPQHYSAFMRKPVPESMTPERLPVDAQGVIGG